MADQANIEAGYCQCGCGGRTTITTRAEPSRGINKGVPRRFIRGHHRRNRDRYVVIELSHDTPCWVWKLARNKDGYGRVRDGGTVKLAHRVEYEEQFGPIPPGLTLDHLCGERGCVNPAHLEPVSLEENRRRAGSVKLRPEDVQVIRSSGDKQRVLAERFSVSQSQISRTKARKSWASLECPELAAAMM